MHRILRPFAVVCALAAFAGCDNFILPAFDDTRPVSGELAVMRQRWEAQGIDDYRYRYQPTCFCVFTDEVVITVEDRRITSVRLVKNGQVVPNDEWRFFPTVDDLFADLAAAQQSGTYNAAAYHPDLGYPMVAVIGTLANDAGVRHHLHDLELID